MKPEMALLPDAIYSAVVAASGLDADPAFDIVGNSLVAVDNSLAFLDLACGSSIEFPVLE